MGEGGIQSPFGKKGGARGIGAYKDTSDSPESLQDVKTLDQLINQSETRFEQFTEPENIALMGIPFAAEHTKKDIFGSKKHLPKPVIPELNQLSQSEIAMQAEKAREEERKRREAAAIRARTIKTGPRGVAGVPGLARERIGV